MAGNRPQVSGNTYVHWYHSGIHGKPGNYLNLIGDGTPGTAPTGWKGALSVKDTVQLILKWMMVWQMKE